MLTDTLLNVSRFNSKSGWLYASIVFLVINSKKTALLSGIYSINSSLFVFSSVFNLSISSLFQMSHFFWKSSSKLNGNGLNGVCSTASGYILSYNKNMYLYIFATFFLSGFNPQSFFNRRYTYNILKSD